MTRDPALTLNSECYCWPVSRDQIIKTITAQNAHPDMADMLAARAHYFASTSVFLDPNLIDSMSAQIRAIEDVIKLPKYITTVRERAQNAFSQTGTDGVFMGYDFHITDDGPRLIEINSNAGGAFIVNMIEKAIDSSPENFSDLVPNMFQSEWTKAGRTGAPKTIAIVDEAPTEQYHYPDMCLAKSMLEARGFYVVIADPAEFRVEGHALYHGEIAIDLIYNRLTDFDLSEPSNASIRRAYDDGLAVVTPAPHHHASHAHKRNLVLLSDPKRLSELGATSAHLNALSAIPKTVRVTPDKADDLWAKRRGLFFKPQAGFGSRGAFRGAKLTKKVWGQILEGVYIAQNLIAPPMRAVTVEGTQNALKFDVRVYTYDGKPLLYAARIYQGQTTNLRTAGGGLAAVIPITTPFSCKPDC